jgi:hypothetical protein
MSYHISHLNGRPYPSVQEDVAGILTVEFMCRPGTQKEGAVITSSEVRQPDIYFNCPKVHLNVKKAIYHGSGWLEISNIYTRGHQLLPSKIVCSALKEGSGINEVELQLEWGFNQRGPIFEVTNSKDREGLFKMSLSGVFSYWY